MFTLTYLNRELRRRAGRTILTVLGLAVGVGLVAAITAVSDGLDQAQRDVLDPLSAVGTDLIVTQPVQDGESGTGRPGGGALGALAQENASLVTDLSELGDPGDRFEHTFFAAASNLTFEQETTEQIAAMDGVDGVAGGLTLTAVHQEGTVPEIVAEIETGGETIEVEQRIDPPTAEERREIERCMAERAPEPAPTPGEQRPGAVFSSECLPERFREFRGQITTPRQTLRQLIDPPQTDITSTTYSIAGVDLSAPGLGLLTEAQILEGGFLAAEGEAVVAQSYAQSKELVIGDELTINDQTFTIVGVASPPFGGQTADVYLPLEQLQAMSGREGRINALYVRAGDASTVGSLGDDIEQRVDGTTVTSAEDVADRISGSLVDAASLADRLGTVLSIALLGAAFLIAILLTSASVGKRVRELGTLKAIGWRSGRVVRQVVGESLTQGALGGIIGIGIGIAAAVAFAAFTPPLEATAAAAQTQGLFGLGALASATPESRSISLGAPISAGTVALAFGLALLGGMIAGAVGAWRAARLRPADALREVG